MDKLVSCPEGIRYLAVYAVVLWCMKQMHITSLKETFEWNIIDDDIDRHRLSYFFSKFFCPQAMV